ncbi:hypothetical protein [Shewanella subflava]|uniref:Uncharacterized protein n=1 Tax=Shewanella subflava TaxID=2986476 RepID=A0ABT3ICI4_9GAMM|nr:hypothetical protein [Shewanella subflava]MCW3173762.1 hypothetical protein [Shewanella subflava]
MKYQKVPNSTIEIPHYLPLAIIAAPFDENKLNRSRKAIAHLKAKLARLGGAR